MKIMGAATHIMGVEIVRHEHVPDSSFLLVMGDRGDRLLQMRGSYGLGYGMFEMQVTRGAYAASGESLMLTSHPRYGEAFGVVPEFDYHAEAGSGTSFWNYFQ